MYAEDHAPDERIVLLADMGRAMARFAVGALPARPDGGCKEAAVMHLLKSAMSRGRRTRHEVLPERLRRQVRWTCSEGWPLGYPPGSTAYETGRQRHERRDSGRSA